MRLPRIYALKKEATLVIVLEENKKGENILFLDALNRKTLTRNEFVRRIKEGIYPNYEIRLIAGKEIPCSKKDGIDNLG